MLKRILKIGMLASIMMCSFSAFAQEDYYPAQNSLYEFYPCYNASEQDEQSAQTVYQYPNYTYDPSWGATLYFSKELNYVWDLRLIGTGHKINNGIGKALSMSVGTTFSIFDALISKASMNQERLPLPEPVNFYRVKENNFPGSP